MDGYFYNWDFRDDDKKMWTIYSNSKLFGNTNGSSTRSHGSGMGGEAYQLLFFRSSHGY